MTHWTKVDDYPVATAFQDLLVIDDKGEMHVATWSQKNGWMQKIDNIGSYREIEVRFYTLLPNKPGEKEGWEEQSMTNSQLEQFEKEVDEYMTVPLFSEGNENAL